MKSIKIPTIHHHYSKVIDLENTEDQFIEIGGLKCIPLGSINIGKNQEELENAKDNGSKLIYGTIAIEIAINNCIAEYYFKSKSSDNVERREEFKRDILETSAIEFSFKKELIKTLIKRGNYCTPDEYKVIESNLKNIMTWRNAFAHGTLNHEHENGSVLEYYSGGHKKTIINDEFWNTVEKIYNDTYSLFVKIQNIILKEK